MRMLKRAFFLAFCRPTHTICVFWLTFFFAANIWWCYFPSSVCFYKKDARCGHDLMGFALIKRRLRPFLKQNKGQAKITGRLIWCEYRVLRIQKAVCGPFVSQIMAERPLFAHLAWISGQSKVTARPSCCSRPPNPRRLFRLAHARAHFSKETRRWPKAIFSFLIT